jgi:hypothetical protein
VNVLDHISEPVKRLGDGGSALIVIGTFADYLPKIAALLTVVWLLIRIWESDTVRAVTGRSILGKRFHD